MSRIGDELAVHASDAHRTQRAVPRDIADHQSGGCADDAQNVRIVFAIRAEENALHLDFVIPTLGEQRTNRAIRQTAGENFLFRRATFALEIAAGEFSGSGGFFAIIDREREKILAGFGFGRGDGRDHHDGFSELNGDGAVGLFGEFAGFDVDLIGPNWAVTFSDICFVCDPLAPEKLQ